jgi:hypothetical protein
LRYVPTIPPPVDQNGDITVPRKGGLLIPVRMQDADGNPIDLTNVPLRFVAGTRVDKMLEVDTSFAGGKMLTLTEDECNDFSTRWTSFSLLDVTTTPGVEVWPGKIRRAS